jgi:chaperonin GroES
MGDFSFDNNLLPLNGTVLVRIMDNPDQSQGGIIIPSTVQQKPMLGKITSTSCGIYDQGTFRPHEVQVGDVVIFKPSVGYDVWFDDQEFRILHETEILAILRGIDNG